MIKNKFKIDNIPAVLWGEKSSKIFIAVHGNMSNKMDVPIEILAQKVVPMGYQVLSFDLPQHGDRVNEPTPCKVQNCVNDIKKIIGYATKISNGMSLFACSIGAYFSLLSFKEVELKQSLFLSPVVDMNRIITNMMAWFNVSEDKLREEKEIQTPIGQTLYWDYYCYVKENPIEHWNCPTSILYGEKDEVSEFDAVSEFLKKFNCDLNVVKDAEHYFYTDEQLKAFENWLSSHLI